MTELIHVGPSDNNSLPYQSLGAIFYDKIKKKNPNRVVLIDNATGEEINYGKLLKLSITLAKALKKLGIKKGDVITIVSQNNWRYLVTIFAGFYIGAKINLLNYDYTSGELKHFLAICQPVVIFCTSKSFEAIIKLKNEPFFPDNIVTYDGALSQLKKFDNLLEDNLDNSNFTPIELNPKEDVALMLTSSGTTGFPKLVMLTHANLRITMTYAGDPNFLDFKEGDSMVAFLPFFHIFGTAVTLASILYGTKCVLMNEFIPDRLLEIIQDYKITKLLTVPPILLFLSKSPMVAKYNISSIRDIMCGAALVTKELEKNVEQHLRIKSLRQVYGMTELGGAATVLPQNCNKSGSVGKVVTTFKIKVCDENGKLLSANQVGELRMQGEGIMKGYLGNVEETATSVDEEGYTRSGDLGYYDEDGFFYIVGRQKEIIKFNGFQVSPAELENLLIQYPSVKDAGVIGIPDERHGEIPLAFIVKQPNKSVTEKEIVRYVEANVSVQKQLYGGVKFVEKIPKTPGGKILRNKLKDLL